MVERSNLFSTSLAFKNSNRNMFHCSLEKGKGKLKNMKLCSLHAEGVFVTSLPKDKTCYAYGLIHEITIEFHCKSLKIWPRQLSIN